MSPYADHRPAALDLIAGASLSAKEGGFLGRVAFSEAITDRQRKWLVILLDRHGLSPLVAGD